MRWMLECDCIEWDWMVLTLDYQLSFPTSIYEHHYIDSLIDPQSNEQLANPQNERQNGILPSQLIMNPRNSLQANLAEDQSLNQCNVVHTLRSGKKVDNQESTQPNPSQHNQTLASISSSPNPSKSDKSETDNSTSQVYKPIVPFPNKLQNNKQRIHTSIK